MHQRLTTGFRLALSEAGGRYAALSEKATDVPRGAESDTRRRALDRTRQNRNDRRSDRRLQAHAQARLNDGVWRVTTALDYSGGFCRRLISSTDTGFAVCIEPLSSA